MCVRHWSLSPHAYVNSVRTHTSSRLYTCTGDGVHQQMLPLNAATELYLAFCIHSRLLYPLFLSNFPHLPEYEFVHISCAFL